MQFFLFLYNYNTLYSALILAFFCLKNRSTFNQNKSFNTEVKSLFKKIRKEVDLQGKLFEKENIRVIKLIKVYQLCKLWKRNSLNINQGKLKAYSRYQIKQNIIIQLTSCKKYSLINFIYFIDKTKQTKQFIILFKNRKILLSQGKFILQQDTKRSFNISIYTYILERVFIKSKKFYFNLLDQSLLNICKKKLKKYLFCISYCTQIFVLINQFIIYNHYAKQLILIRENIQIKQFPNQKISLEREYKKKITQKI
ncbi:transmembrane protein, putative (macronuclear) [Tetrahymena thermophila SB210]|uniref:Transmembrane protein, putative n=1 Tax=Tetrahymena thermophila (strain SB210) TaxID=312017 RepID=W7X3T9_TETTS|nr:transmembrane protein, putative [Tetrahymena thermophila SB210]EWS72107.1 transmembrane protein, putative [Tetrahymena thermophila SB210]|eukprot:XP_012655360.1 transmembrane protein, putative [Tetrahymena thermophila SB210]